MPKLSEFKKRADNGIYAVGRTGNGVPAHALMWHGCLVSNQATAFLNDKTFNIQPAINIPRGLISLVCHTASRVALPHAFDYTKLNSMSCERLVTIKLYTVFLKNDVSDDDIAVEV